MSKRLSDLIGARQGLSSKAWGELAERWDAVANLAEAERKTLPWWRVFRRERLAGVEHTYGEASLWATFRAIENRRAS